MTSAPVSTSSEADEGPLNRRIVYVIFGALLAAMFLSSLDQSVVGTALPTIVGELHAVDHEGWIVTAYLLAIAIVMPIYGKIGDMYGRRWPFLFAITVFVAGSALSGMAQSFEMLVAARAFQGLGAGGLVILSQATIADIVSARDRGKFMGPMGAVFGVAAVAGPLLGGWFTEGPGWRWSFWINVPIGIIVLLIVFFTLRLPMHKSAKNFDFVGAVLLAAFTAGIVLLTSWKSIVPSGYDWSNRWLVFLMVGTVVSFILFLWVEIGAEDPLVPLHMFKDPVFSVSVTIAFILGVSMFAALSFLPTFLQMARGDGPTESGLMMLPMSMGVMLTAIVSGLLITKTGKYRIYPIIGMAITTVSIAWLTQLTGDMSTWLFWAMIFALGMGMGFTIQTIVIAVQNSVDPHEVGTATSTNNFLREIGAAVSTSVFGTLFTSRLANNFAELKQTVPVDQMPTHQIQGDLTPDMVKSLPEPLHTDVVDAYVNAMAPSFWYLVPIAAIGFVASLFLRNRALNTKSAMEARGESLESV